MDGINGFARQTYIYTVERVYTVSINKEDIYNFLLLTLDGDMVMFGTESGGWYIWGGCEMCWNFFFLQC